MNAGDSYQEFLQVLGKTIRDLRKDRGYTQLELAKRAKRNQSSVAKVESAPPSDLSLRVVYELASGLSMSTSELLQAAEARSRSQLPVREHKSDEYWATMQEVIDTLPERRKSYVKRIISEVVSGVQEI